MMPYEPPLIMTLAFDAHTFAALDDLRRQHFPAYKNVVPTHITLFHALPGEHEDSIQHTLHTLCAATPVLPIFFPQVRSLGRGVALGVDCPALLRLRQQLATTWHDWLTEQDRRAYRPHVTIQNKVTPAEAQQLYDQLAATWTPFMGQGTGLRLWRYLHGPWELANEFPFRTTSTRSPGA